MPLPAPRPGSVDTILIEPPVSRLCVLGDPHGAVRETTAVMAREEDGRTRSCCVGDVVGYADAQASSALAERLERLAVPTVEGNHEQWVQPDGRLAIVERRGYSRTLSPNALRWIRSLPTRIEFRQRASHRPLAVMIHSIRTPQWDWIGVGNARSVLEELDSPPILIAGHSHRPRFIVVPPVGQPSATAFDFEDRPEIVIDLPSNGSSIIDAGSLGRAELDSSPTAASRADSRRRYGTYAMVDFELQIAILRRQEMLGG